MDSQANSIKHLMEVPQRENVENRGGNLKEIMAENFLEMIKRYQSSGLRRPMNPMKNI